MSIFITGDIHGDLLRFHKNNFPVGQKLTKGDIVIICGDFGLIFGIDETENEWKKLKWLNEQPWTTIFVDGNHENFTRLHQYKIEEKWGGKVHRIRDSIYHLMRGEVYQIQGKSIFAFGGAFSHDREYRIKGYSWWEEELPTDVDCLNALENLKKVDHQVDIVLTHDAPRFIAKAIGFGDSCMDNGYPSNAVNILDYLELLENKIQYQQWYCGHYHIDEDFTDSFHFLYHQILDSETHQNVARWEF